MAVAQNEFSFEEYFSKWQKKGVCFTVNDSKYRFGKKRSPI